MVQTRLSAYGGAHLVSAWIMQALAETYDLSIVTWKNIDFAAIDRYYGTSLQSSQIKILSVHRFFHALPRLDPDPQSIQPNMLVMRLAKKLRAQYDLIVTAEMEYDFGGPEAGRPIVQYLHHPGFWHLPANVRSSSERRGWARILALITGKLKPWIILGDYSFDRMRTNRTLTNSHWTERWIGDFYGIPATVIYPPAPGEYAPLPWEQRENGVLCIGRLNPTKRADWVIEQLLPLRSRFGDLHLHIVGNQSNSKIERTYYRRLIALVDANRDWVTLHENISRNELAELACRQRYGVHAAQLEHFGIAVAEMVRAGCIPLVHNSGGQVEIVGGDPRLTFEDDQLAERLSHILANPSEQSELCKLLTAQAALFTPQRFMEEMRQLVRSALDQTGLA